MKILKMLFKTPLKIGTSFKKNKKFVTMSNKLNSKYFKTYLSKNIKIINLKKK